jgi:YfiH family protein
MKIESDPFYSVPGWVNIPFLVHGFGDKTWKTHDLKAHPRMQNFHLLFLRQVHSDILHVIDRIPEEILRGDALLTDKPGMLLIIKTADCLPVLIVDPEKKVVAAIHCGWKSTSQQLAGKVVACMEKHYHCVPSSLKVAFGPCIGKDCYEVGEEVKQEFAARGLTEDVFIPQTQDIGKYYLDLQLSNKHQLMKRGIPEPNIEMVDLCSHCEDSLLSYRRSPETKDRMLSFIGMTP